MSILFTCSCGEELTTEDAYAGQQVECPSCRRVVTVPGPGPAAGPGPAIGQGATGGEFDESGRFKVRSYASLGLGIGAVLLNIIVFVVFAILAFQDDSYEPAAAVGVAIMVLVAVAAVVSVVALVLGALGMKRANTRYRGAALAGLILGILCTCLAGCCLGLMAIGAVGALADMA